VKLRAHGASDMAFDTAGVSTRFDSPANAENLDAPPPVAPTPIVDAHWDLIVKRIYGGKCVPFLGAGVNASSTKHGYEGLPLGKDVALNLLSKLTKKPLAELQALADADVEPLLAPYGDLVRPSITNLARVALRYVTSNDYADMLDELGVLLAEERCEPSLLLQVLARLPFKLIVTTNYDGLMERALGERPFTSVVQPVRGFVDGKARRKVQADLSKGDALVLYKLHGSLESDGSSGGSLLITEEDYIEYLTVVGVKDVGVPSLIAEKITDSTLLFLGYSLEDWDFRTIFKGIVGKLPEREQRKSFAIQSNPTDFWVTLWKKENVEIYNVDLHDFARELERRCDEYERTQR
jgi:SIR2-like domain